MTPTPSDLQKAARRRPRKGKAIRPPSREQARLRRAMGDLWKQHLWPATERIKQLVKQGASPQAIADEIEQTLYLATQAYGHRVKSILDNWILGVDRSVQDKIYESMHAALGIDITAVLQRPDVADAMSVAGMRAAGLITKMPQDYLGKIAGAVADNFAGNGLPEGRSLIEQIQHISGVEYKRAKLLARDQTSKLTGALVAVRQQSVGVEMYIWRTSKDERVVGDPTGISPVGNSKHGDHYHMEGFYFKWSDNSVYSDDEGATWKPRPATWSQSIPGNDIQCRCFGESVISPEQVIAFVESQQNVVWK